MNQQDQIRIIAIKMDAVQRERMRMLEADTHSLECLNEVLESQDERTENQRFLDCLEDMRQSIGQ